MLKCHFLKNILFKEGINLGEILNEKEKILHNIVEIFSSYENNDYGINLNLNLDDLKEENNFLKKELDLFNDDLCEKTLEIFQKKLVNRNVAYNVGGENDLN